MQENNVGKTANKNLSYMLFVLGIILIIVGAYLATYSRVEMVNQSISVGGFSMKIPQAQQVQPYLSIGIIAILSAVALIGIALYKVTRTI